MQYITVYYVIISIRLIIFILIHTDLYNHIDYVTI